MSLARIAFAVVLLPALASAQVERKQRRNSGRRAAYGPRSDLIEKKQPHG
jgi:hypothetical protein